MIVRFFFLLVMMSVTLGQAFAFDTSEPIARLFESQGVKGTFVAYAPETDQDVGHNAERAAIRYVPASTFKIPNSLIGLSTSAVRSVDEVFFQYDGKPLYLKSWERDMGLRDAIRVSNVPAYQELARRIGLEAMRTHVQDMNYGNTEIGEVVDEFWLEGPLRISALEQTRFLAKLAQGQLPYPEAIQKAVRDICKLEQGNGWVLYGKTGSTSRAKQPYIGWFVGWVERNGQITTFALNMDMNNQNLATRIALAKASLRVLGLL